MAFKNKRLYQAMFHIGSVNIILSLILLINYINAPMAVIEITKGRPVIRKPVVIKVDYNRKNILAVVAKCESSTRYDAQNRGSSAFGKYQIIYDTWVDAKKALGKDLTIINPEHQERAANWLMDTRGMRPWNESKGCWSKIIGNNPKP